MTNKIEKFLVKAWLIAGVLILVYGSMFKWELTIPVGILCYIASNTHDILYRIKR